MTILKVGGFEGEIPRIVPRLLPENAATRSTNARLESGGLTPYRKPKFTARLPGVITSGSVRTIYRDDGVLPPQWLSWDKQVYIAPGPVATERLYVMGDGAPKMRSNGVWYPLALPLPPAGLVATPSGTGTGDVFSRVYAYTWVTNLDEETEPCPLSNTINWQNGQTVTLSGIQNPPAGTRINRMRFYRSQTSMSGTDLYFIAERPVSNTNFVDNIPLNQQNEPIPSLNWNPPPDDLTGLIQLPNGMMAAFRDKELCFCEPWMPHAWPESYRLTVSWPIVAIAAFGTTIVVMTKGQPYIVNGASPDTMVEEKIELNLPCINPRGVVDLGYSIGYPSHDGLVVVSSSGARVVTDQLMTRRDWLTTAPATFVASQFYGRYFASYEYIDPSGNAATGSFVIDLSGQSATMHRVSYRADAMWYDVANGTMFMCMGTDVYEWDALDAENDVLTWRSKQFIANKPTNFGVIRIEGTEVVSAEEEAAQQAAVKKIVDYNNAIYAQHYLNGDIGGNAFNEFPLNGDALMPMPSSGKFVSVTVYADGRAVRTSSKFNRVDRLPSGFLARVWEIEVSTNADISQISLAQTGAELAGA